MRPPTGPGGTYRPLGEREGPGPRPVGESLDRLARHLGAPSSAALSRLFDRWETLVGAVVAAHCRPLSLSRGVLVVAADSAPWAAQLGWLEADLLARLAGHLGPGVVTSLSVRVRPR